MSKSTAQVVLKKARLAHKTWQKENSSTTKVQTHTTSTMIHVMRTPSGLST